MLNTKNVRTKEQLDRMQLAQKNDICPFCPEGLTAIHQEPVLYHTKNFFITKNAFPYDGTEHHLLIVPMKHVKNVTELSNDNWAEIGTLFKWVCEYKNIDDGSLFFRFGNPSHPTSSLEHLHIHIIVGDAKSDNSDEEVEPIKVKLGYKKI